MTKQVVYGWAGPPVGPPSVSIPRDPARPDGTLGIRLIYDLAGGDVNQIYYGSNHGYYSPEPPSSGYEGRPTESVGFRLVHDDSGRAFRDGSWQGTSQYVRSTLYFTSDPDYCSPSLSFRLAREAT